MTLKKLNDNYVYQGDKNLDNWQEMKPNKYGKYIGDCEDYCITLKNNVSEFSDWDYYYCKLSGDGHCILHKEGYVIDCNVKKVVSLEQYNRMFTVTELKKYHLFVIWSKIVFAKVYTWIS